MGIIWRLIFRTSMGLVMKVEVMVDRAEAMRMCSGCLSI